MVSASDRELPIPRRKTFASLQWDYFRSTLFTIMEDRVINVKEFKAKATKFVNGKDEIVVTKFGKPVALLTPIRSKSPEALMLSMGEILREAGISRKEAQSALERVRRRLYGPHRS